GRLSRSQRGLDRCSAQEPKHLPRGRRDVQKRGFARGTEGLRRETCAAVEGKVIARRARPPKQNPAAVWPRGFADKRIVGISPGIPTRRDGGRPCRCARS